MWMRMIVVLAVLAVLPGCSTRYQEMGITGGVAADQMTSNTYRIRSRGNAYTSGSAVQDYVLLKAAETTKSVGGTHFQIISAGDASRQVSYTSPGSSQTTLVGRNSAFTTYTPAETTTLIKPGQDAFIRVVTVPTGSQPPSGAISADEIINFVGSRVKRD